MRRSFLALALLAFSFAAIASEPVRVDLSRVDFKAQSAAIVDALNKNPNYVEVSAEKLKLVQASLDRILQILGGSQSVSQLGVEESSEALALQNSINAILDKGEKDSRWTCRLEKKLGTNLPTRVCSTAAERNRQHEIAVERRFDVYSN